MNLISNFNMSKYLITGGAGFIGGNFLQIMVNKYPYDRFVCLDKLTYAGNLKNLDSIMNKENFRFVLGDICDENLVFNLFEEEGFDYVINFAAETHVDRSYKNPEIFFKTNVFGTQVLLEACKKYGIKRFHQVSTDEVFGDLRNTDQEFFSETSPLNPSSPYSASKASADLLVLAYHKSFKLPVTISRSSNNYGPGQYPEKLIPFLIGKALRNELLPLYGDGENIRDWIFVEDHCKAIDLIVRNGVDGEVYNVCSNHEKTNLDVANSILNILNKPKSLISFVRDRPSHDFRYTMNSEKIKKLGWTDECGFESGIRITIRWYIENLDRYKID